MKKFIPLLCCFLLLVFPPAYGSDFSYELGFSPNGESLQIVLNGISDAKESILVAAYSFTSRPIAEALLAAHRRGVRVAVIADKKGNSTRYTAVHFLVNHGITVRLNGQYAIMHHKFMVIDETAVQLGSFNYSASAVNKNAENVLLLKNIPDVASRYADEWNKLWNESIDVVSKY